MHTPDSTKRGKRELFVLKTNLPVSENFFKKRIRGKQMKQTCAESSCII